MTDWGPKPSFVDNRDGRTLAASLQDYLDRLAGERREPITLSVATGYFNPEGFSLLADHLEGVDQVRLLLGAEPLVPPKQYWRKPGEPRGESYHAEQVRQALQSHKKGLEEDRDLLGFAPEVDHVLTRLLQFLRSGKVEVRRFERGFLHGKAFLFSHQQGVLAGSSNFTRAGLTSNLELNLGHYQPEVIDQVADWFDDLWEEADPYDLAALYEARYQAYDPYLIYLRVLFELYGDEIEEESEETGRVQLTNFQTDGVSRARRILDRYNGVIIADGVGLGKSFIAGRLLEETVREERKRALLIAPAALRDSTWDRFLDRHQLHVESYSYEQFRNDVQLGGEGHYLKNDRNDYSMVVIDEGHAFRNPDTQQAQALRRMLRGDPPKDLVLLTATPVNNSLWDLYYLINYFAQHDAVFAEAGIPSLKSQFEAAQQRDPRDLTPDLLYDVIDRTTVRRTRHFVKEWYPNEVIPGPEGEDLTIVFPKPEVRRIDYELEEALPGFLDEFGAALAGEGAADELSLARYWPSRYKRGVDPKEDPDWAREGALVGLIRSGLLKRFESSVHAFAETAARMANANQAVLDGLDQGMVASPQAIGEWQEVDSDEAWEELLEETGSEPAAAYDVTRLRADLQKDRDLLRRFARRARTLTRDQDPKLEALTDALAEIARQAEREGVDDEDARQKRKVLIFTYFEDTVNWVEDHLLDAVEEDDRLSTYRGRIASVAGSDSRRGITREAAVYGFAPRSTEAPAGRREDRFDLLVATDVLAEGMNLQQCRHIINFDLPWNPMRVVQRHGRIDRIGSPHSHVYMRCFFPAEKLDELLELELRVRSKLAQAAATVGIESKVIPGTEAVDRNFADTREQIEALEREEETLLETAGEDPGAHSAEEYRQELRQGLRDRGGEIRQLPWASGSGLKGPRTGHFFCARVGDEIRLRFVPLEEDEEVEQKTLSCLRMITCERDAERHLPEGMYETAYQAWETAREDIYEDWQYATDPANLQPRIRPLFRQVADHLRDHPPTDMEHEDLIEVLESVEAPRGMRHENALREVWNRFHDDQDEVTEPQVLSAALVEKVRELGLQPYRPPEPLPPIEEEEIKLVCWMAVVDSEDDGTVDFGGPQADLDLDLPYDQLQLGE